MEIRRADPEDLADLARLLWLHASPEEQQQRSVELFTDDLGTWWAAHRDTHLPFVARSGDETVGVAWLALFPRVPRPGTDRLNADVQSVFVLAEHRGRGIGSALLQAVAEHAEECGATRVTVHSSRRAVPVYERLGFASSRQLLQRPQD